MILILCDKINPNIPFSCLHLSVNALTLDTYDNM
jgi:hypothetical protein